MLPLLVDSRLGARLFGVLCFPTFSTPLACRSGATVDAQGRGRRLGAGVGHSSHVMAAKMAYDVMASFTCPRTITFQDYRLGFTHKAIVVAILAYVCFNLFSGQLYLVDSVPLGLVSVWSTSDYNGTSGVSSFSHARDAFYDDYSANAKNGSFRYCGNDDYDYVYDASYTYEKIRCAFQEDAELAVKGESQIFFSTMVQTNTVAFVSTQKGETCGRSVFEDAGVSDAECPSSEMEDDYASVAFTEELGRCYCRATKNAFNVAAENLTVSMEHKYEALYGRGELPRTFVRREDSLENLHEFAPGEALHLPLWRVLEFVGLSLDEYAAGGESSLKGVSSSPTPNGQPKLRVKGLQITAKMQYYNYHQAPGFENERDGKPGETVCILSLSPQDMWAALGNDVSHFPSMGSAGSAGSNVRERGGFENRYRYGIKVVIQASGVISAVDLMFMINAVIQGLVLLNVAVIITQQVAFYLLGDRSKMYKEFGNETAIFEREAARFAIQSIVAGHVFRLVDADKSGGLDHAEIYDAIQESAAGSGLSEEEMNTLAGFVIHQADLDSEKHKAWLGEDAAGAGDEQEGVIGLAEWDNLFASGFMDFHSLSRVVRNLSKEESSFLLERAKTFKAGLGGRANYGAIEEGNAKDA